MEDVTTINAETGEIEVRFYTPAEMAQLEADKAAVEAETQARETALTKLQKLGLSVEDLQALGLV